MKISSQVIFGLAILFSFTAFGQAPASRQDRVEKAINALNSGPADFHTGYEAEDSLTFYTRNLVDKPTPVAAVLNGPTDGFDADKGFKDQTIEFHIIGVDQHGDRAKKTDAPRAQWIEWLKDPATKADAAGLLGLGSADEAIGALTKGLDKLSEVDQKFVMDKGIPCTAANEGELDAAKRLVKTLNDRYAKTRKEIATKFDNIDAENKKKEAAAQAEREKNAATSVGDYVHKKLYPALKKEHRNLEFISEECLQSQLEPNKELLLDSDKNVPSKGLNLFIGMAVLLCDKSCGIHSMTGTETEKFRSIGSKTVQSTDRIHYDPSVGGVSAGRIDMVFVKPNTTEAGEKAETPIQFTPSFHGDHLANAAVADWLFNRSKGEQEHEGLYLQMEKQGRCKESRTSLLQDEKGGKGEHLKQTPQRPPPK